MDRLLDALDRADPSLGPTITLAARITLVVIFALAGANKLYKPLGAASAAVRFRVVGQATRGIGYTLGVAELAIAALLLAPGAGTVAGCLAAGLMSVGFAVVSARSLGRGERFPCACLTVSIRATLSWLTVWRAAAMALAAVIGGLGVLRYGAAPASPVNALNLAIVAIGLPLAAHLWWRVRRRQADLVIIGKGSR